MNTTELVDSTLSALDYCLNGRDDFFLTTSFGYQSAILFFLFSELAVPIKCLFIKSPLSFGGIDHQIDYSVSKFDIDVKVVDRSSWLHNELMGQEFLSLSSGRRKEICKNLKRGPLLEFIEAQSYKIWVSGIRKDQTKARNGVQFMEVTDLNVIKLSPLRAWSRKDVQNSIARNDLRINADYVDLCKLNESRECGLHF